MGTGTLGLTRRVSFALRLHAFRVGALAVLILVAADVRPLDAQSPDTVVAPDSVNPGDTAVVAPEGTTQAVETVSDSLRVMRFPTLTAPQARRPERAGVWEWGREALLLAPGLSLLDLVREVPGIRIVRAGDYGAPAVVAAFGLSAGRVRVFQDGVELLPMEGGVVDLSLIGLSGLDRVRVERFLGGINIELESRRETDPRPYTQIEAGTGDLETNFFRGTFLMSRAPGGSLLLTIDRIDTNGRENEDPGTVNGIFARYAASPSDRFGAEVTLLKRSAQRSLYTPLKRDRTDWTGRIRAAPTEGSAIGLFAGTSALSTEDSTTTPDVRQLGLEASWSGTHASVRGSARRLDGEGLATWMMRGSATFEAPRVGALNVSLRRESWSGASAQRLQAGLWTRRIGGLSLFAETDRGGAAVPARLWALTSDSTFMGFPEEPLGVDERTGVRVGASFDRWGLLLTGARLRVDADSIRRYGLPFDAGEGAVEGGERSAWEAQVEIPLLIFDGLSAVGNAVLWDDETPWPYTPRLQYDARVRFYDQFLPTQNFELLVELGIQEREKMALFGPLDEASGMLTLEETRFHQSWFARLHMRIVSLQLFVHWENLSTRMDNQDILERLLPRTRTYYGVRWGLWN